MAFSGVFEKRRVLVTGHTGFKGAWLSLWLRELGASVVGYALEPDTQPSLFALVRGHEGIDHIVGDLRDSASLSRVFERSEPEVVFHLAAQSLVRRGYREPKATWDTNLLGTVNVLEAARHTASVRAMVIVTTDKCYENKEWVWGYRENDRLGGYDPYSASKAAAEMAVASYRRSFFNDHCSGVPVGIATARAGNVIGGGDWAEDRLLPDAIRSVTTGREIQVRNPKSVRPWQHVLEPLAGYLALATRLLEKPREYSQAWNFGPSRDQFLTVMGLLEQFLRELSTSVPIVLPDTGTDTPHETDQLWLCCDKANTLLGWEPVLTTESAIRATASWYKKVLFENCGAQEECLKSISGHLDLARRIGVWWAM